jgi:hypothetical protein
VNPEWFYSVGDSRQGPVTEDELKRLAADGTLKPADLVWKDGMSDWVEARTVDALFPRTARRRDDDYEPLGGSRDDDRRRSRSRDDEDHPRASRRDTYEDDDRPRARRSHDDRDDYDEEVRPRRPQKPGQVQAVAIMLLVGGILGLLTMLGAALGSIFFCCLWPGMYFEIVWAILAIVRASNMLGRDDQPSPNSLAVCQIICIVNGDIVNCILGIVCLVMLNDPAVAAYYRRRNY